MAMVASGAYVRRTVQMEKQFLICYFTQGTAQKQQTKHPASVSVKIAYLLIFVLVP